MWLSEHHPARLPGVKNTQANNVTHRLLVRWDERPLKPSDILNAVTAIGYAAHPDDPRRSQLRLERGAKTPGLRRFGLAGLMTAQVMTLSVAPLPRHRVRRLDSEASGFLHWASLLLTPPALPYSAQPFLRGAWTDLTHLRAGMDVPVGARHRRRVWRQRLDHWHRRGRNLLRLGDHVRLPAARQGATQRWRARTRATEAAESLVRAVPATATRLVEGGAEETVPAAELTPGDAVLVRPGKPCRPTARRSRADRAWTKACSPARAR